MKYNKGLTFAELLTTIAIVSCIIISISAFFARGLIAVKKNQALLPGYDLAKGRIEQIRRCSYDTLIASYLPSPKEVKIFQNGITYNMEVNTEVIYRPEISGTSNDGRSLLRVTVNVQWEAIKEQGKKNITLQTYIYTDPLVFPVSPL